MATVTITLGHCVFYVRGVTEYVCVHADLHSRVAQLCLTLCDTMDCSPSDSPVHRIVQAGILELLFPTLWQIDSLPLCHLGVLRIFVCVCVCVCVCILTYFVNLKAESIIIL